MPALRKYDQETRDRAVRMYQDRRRDFADESALQARRRVGELLDVKPETLRGWVERVEIDAGQRPGVPSSVEARIKELERENAEPPGRSAACGSSSRQLSPEGMTERLRTAGATAPVRVIATLGGPAGWSRGSGGTRPTAGR
jgi:transposase-like protein